VDFVKYYIFNKLEQESIHKYNSIKCKFKQLDGFLHCEDGPALKYQNGAKFYYLYGKLHRLDGPAVIDSKGNATWFLNGIIHNLHGPAIIWSTRGKTLQEWWINGIQMTQMEHTLLKKCNICCENKRSLITINDIILYCPKCQR
jgi:hypothetical protein